MNKTIYLIGSGMGSVETMTVKGAELLRSCGEIYATRRLAEGYKNIREDIIEASIDEIKEKVCSSISPLIGVLISGDTGFYSVAKRFYNDFSTIYIVKIIPGINSLQYMAAKACLSYDDIHVISLHGRDGSVLGAVSYNEKVFVLTGGSRKAHDICKELVNAGFGSVEVIIGENLSSASERVLKASATEAAHEVFSDMTSIIIINKNFVDNYKVCKDDDFIRGDIPMTKEEVRKLCVASLAPSPKDILFDIGAGTGSVSVELARKASTGLVYAIEREAEGIELINKNREKFGAYNVLPIFGEATKIMDGLPAPDKAFIGGSGGNMQKIIDVLVSKNTKIKLVISIITIETLMETVKILKNHSFETNIVCINASKAKKVGDYNMMIANNPVYIITGERIDGE